MVAERRWITILSLILTMALLLPPAARRAPVVFHALETRWRYDFFLRGQTHSQKLVSSWGAVYFQPWDEPYARLVLRQVNSYAPLLTRDFQLPPGSARVTVVIYGSQEDFSRAVGGGTGAVGAYYGGVIHLLPPRLWRTASQDASDSAPLHELAHLFVDLKTGGNCLPWLNEGVAQWYERKYDPADNPAAAPVNLGELNNWNELNYDAAQSAGELVARIAGRYGEAGLQGLLTAQAEGQKLWTNP